MIVAQIKAKRHPGCPASDVSYKFRETLFPAILVSYEEDNYEVVFILNWEKEKLKLIPDILVELSKHPLWRETIELRNIRCPSFLVRFEDMGYTEALFRHIVYEKDAHLPIYQLLTAKDGEEIIYATFETEKALNRVRRQLENRIGKKNIETMILASNARPSDIVDLIPIWFEQFLTSGEMKVLKRVMKRAAMRKRLLKTHKRSLQRIYKRWPEIINIVLYTLRKIFDFFGSTK